jgi:uncharacterized damage-inducible protein DinB
VRSCVREADRRQRRGGAAFIAGKRPRLALAWFHISHANEHYGNIVTYLRLKGIVPPSSEPR